MEVTHDSSLVPQAIANNLPDAEDASTETPEPVPHPLEASYDRDRKPSLQEILETTSTTMEFISTITSAFYEKGDQNSRFREELRKKVLILAMNVHAWASARAVHEHTAARDALEAEIQKLVEDERDQGKSSHLVPKSTFDRMRARLSEMFEAINNTVANLAGLC